MFVALGKRFNGPKYDLLSASFFLERSENFGVKSEVCSSHLWDILTYFSFVGDSSPTAVVRGG